MSECIVIADDLTGGNATGVLLKKMKYVAHTVLNIDAIDPDTRERGDCLIYPANSRGMSPQDAYDTVYSACNSLKAEEVLLYSHRIDSTLRGNLGMETDAMLDCLGDDYMAIVAPCFPATNRIICGGYMLFNSIPLHKTIIAIDPKCPVTTSDVAKIFRNQSQYPVESMDISDLMQGSSYIAGRLTDMKEKGVRTVTFDCITQEDLDLIGDAVIESGLKIIAVDPGVFTATMARKLIKPKEDTVASRILAVVGSVNPNAKTQMAQLWLSQKTNSVMVDTGLLMKSKEDREKEIGRVTEEILAAADSYQVSTVCGNGIYPENRIDFSGYMKKHNCTLDEATEVINSALAEIAYRVFDKDRSFRAMYTSGGDVTISVCRRFNTSGLRLRDEVLPLAAYGKFLGGEFDGVHIITKGGSQGGPDAINQCITYLKEKLYI